MVEQNIKSHKTIIQYICQEYNTFEQSHNLGYDMLIIYACIYHKYIAFIHVYTHVYRVVDEAYPLFLPGVLLAYGYFYTDASVN